MRSKITVIGTGETSEALVATLAAADHSDVVRVMGEDEWETLAGSRVVVLVDGDAELVGREVARRASGAVIVLATAEPLADTRAALASSLLPRARVFGVEQSPPAVMRAVEAVIFDRGVELRAAAHCRGECGHEDKVARVPVTVGRGGLRGIG